jgi:hypothetical protein
MKYTIIEDCSPYYIRFTWDELPELIEFIKQQPSDKSNSRSFKGYRHTNYDLEIANAILDRLPMNNDFDFIKTRVALFTTYPRGKSSVHKDSVNHRFSINIPLEINDEKCITGWWDDELLKDFELVDTLSSRSIGFREDLPLPIKTMIAVPNECILFNTDIYHDWDNTQSENQRIMLTLRINNPGLMYYDEAKKKLFGI